MGKTAVLWIWIRIIWPDPDPLHETIKRIRYGSADTDLDQNDTDPQHWAKGNILVRILQLSRARYIWFTHKNRLIDRFFVPENVHSENESCFLCLEPAEQ